MTPLKQESESALLQNQDLTWTNHIPDLGVKQNLEDVFPECTDDVMQLCKIWSVRFWINR